MVRRMLVGVPVAVLLIFGLLHVAEAFYGQALFPWDADAYDKIFLPNWGKPGHYGAGLAEYPTDATRDVFPIPCHSHNDYWRRVPVFEAIHWGCTSIEADVWLYDEELFVGHNTASLTRKRTFRSLYVDPLTEFLDKMNQPSEFSNGTRHGVFDTDPNQTLVLLVDFKTNGRDTYRYVHDQLGALREKDYLSFWDGERMHTRAVTVVGTGNAPFDLINESESHRDIFFDAPLNEFWDPASASPSTRPSMDSMRRRGDENKEHDPAFAESVSASAYTPANSYYASVSFTKAIGFVWRGELTPQQLELIRGQIRGAQARGLKARYWDTPSWPRGLRNHIWDVLMTEGADVLNVDDLRSAAVQTWRARARHSWGQ